MKLVSSQQMRQIDEETIASFEIPGELLMDRAGLGVADIVLYLARMSGFTDPIVRAFAGRGNNGGDAFVAATYLKKRGVDVEVWLAGEARAVRGDALTHLGRMRTAGVPLHEVPTLEEWDDVFPDDMGGDIVVDGVLGTGISGPARGPAAGAIRCIRDLSGRSLVLSIDVPSGLNSDTGEALGDVVVADVTATMGLPKTGLVQPCAVEFVGSVEVVDIGVPDELVERVRSDVELVTPRDLQTVLPRRPRRAHKGTFGHVLVIGGAPGYSGAVSLAARAALRGGAGLVSALVPESIAPAVTTLVPEVMVHAADATKAGCLSSSCIEKWSRDLGEFSAVLVGPGLTSSAQSRLLVEGLLSGLEVPLVVDADGLNVCAGRLQALHAARCPCVVTPHPGEMGRLLGKSTEDIQADRFGAAREAAAETGAVVVLKGAGTVIAQDGQPLQVVLNGNPGMATGGTGDVLAGLLTALLAQGCAPFDAARAAVYLHGRAGDNAAWRTSQVGMTALDLLDEVPGVLREVAPR